MKESARKIVDETIQDEKEEPKEVDEEGVKKDNEEYYKRGHSKMNKKAKRAVESAENTMEKIHSKKK